MRRLMIAYINWLSTKSSAKLRNICDSNMIQSPKQIFIECNGAFQ